MNKPITYHKIHNDVSFREKKEHAFESVISILRSLFLCCHATLVTTQRPAAYETSVNVVTTAAKQVFILLAINKTWLLRYLLVTAFL